MPNDAKLGLLAGVLGVIVAGILTANRPRETTGAPPTVLRAGAPDADAAVEPVLAVAPAPRAVASPRPAEEDDVPAALPNELPSTPVVRSKPEPPATPAGRKREDDR